MLTPSEFFVGTIGEATPLTLILPRHEHEPVALVGRAMQSGAPAVFFLDDRNKFKWFECADNEHWSGIQVPNVQIEVDETSVFDPEHTWPKPGCVVRHRTQLIAIPDLSFHSSRGMESVVLVEDLTPSSKKAGFTRWQVLIGQGSSKRILHTVNAADHARGPK
jgi:hypothetical protein